MRMVCVRCGAPGAHVFSLPERPLCEECYAELIRKGGNDNDGRKQYPAGTERNAGSGAER